MHSETIINILYKKLIGGEPTADELEMLRKWVEESPRTRQDLVDKMSDWESITQEYRLREHIDTVRPYNDMCERLGIDRDPMASANAEQPETEECPDTEPRQKDSFRKRLSRLRHLDVLKYVAAAAIVSVTLLYFALPKHSVGNHVTPAGRTLAVADKMPMTLDRLSPGKSRAVIILPGGDTIRLSESGSRSLKAAKTVPGGRLQLDVPRGGEFAIVLEDSTKVWLNSESKLF